MERKGRPGAQRTLESLAKVVVLPSASHAFSQADVLTLKRQLETPDSSSAVLLTALRTLSCLDLKLSDLQSSMVGRAANRLRCSADLEVAKLASKLVAKWREVDCAASLKRKGGTGGPGQAVSRPRATLAETGAAFDVELSRPRHSSAPGAAARDACRAALTAVLGNNRTAASLEGAMFEKAASRYVQLSQALPRAISANPSLHSALLSGWLTPAEAMALPPAKLTTQDFLAA